MSKFIELTYKTSDEKFFVNTEYITNFQNWDGNSTMISLMPHFEPDPDLDQPFPPVPFLVHVKECVEDVLHAVRNAE